jgi:hypothetical protein
LGTPYIRSVNEEVLKPAFRHKKICKKKEERIKFLARCLTNHSLFLFIAVRKSGVPYGWRLLCFRNNNSVWNESKVECFKIFEKSELDDTAQMAAQSSEA